MFTPIQSMDQLNSKTELEYTDKCDECNSRAIKDYHHSLIFCSKCGLELEKLLFDERSISFEYDSNTEKSFMLTHGPKIEYAQEWAHLTEINPAFYDYWGKPIPSRNRVMINRIKIWDKRIKRMKSETRSIIAGSRKIDEYSSSLKLTRTVRQQAKRILTSVIKTHSIVGRSIERMSLASIYAACREMDYPRSLKEIVKEGGEDFRKVNKNFKYIVKSLNLNLPAISKEAFLDRIFNEYIGYLDNNNLLQELKKRSFEILNQLDPNHTIMSLAPNGVTGAIAYYSAVEYARGNGGKPKLRQKILGECAYVTEITIRNQYKNLISILGEPQPWSS